MRVPPILADWEVKTQRAQIRPYRNWVLFIACFGPIVRDVDVSRKLYSQTLGIGFKEEAGDYLHTEALEGAKTFALWGLSQAAQSCFGKDSWPDHVPAPQAWLFTGTTA